MNKLCLNCHFIGKGKFTKFYNDWFFGDSNKGIILIIVGFSYIIFKWGDDPLFIYKSIIPILLILFGIFCVIQNSRGGEICPECEKQGMIKLDKPEAAEIMKEKNLSLPE